jgi:hypothetical protein
MFYSYVEIDYVATSFSPARTDLALKLLMAALMDGINLEEPISSVYPAQPGLTWRNPSGWPA